MATGHSNFSDIAIEAGKAAPPVAVTGAHVVLGLTLADWVAIVTLMYLALQIVLLIPRYRAAWVQYRAKRKECRECLSKRE